MASIYANFIGTKETFCMRNKKEFNSHRIGSGHQHGRRFIVLGHQYGRCDVRWKHSMYINKPVGSQFGQMVRKIMVSFIPESCLPFAQIIEFYRKTAAKAWNCFFFPFEKLRPGIQDYFFRCSRCSGIFFPERHQKQCSMYFSNGFVGKLFILNCQTASTFPRIVWLGGVVGGGVRSYCWLIVVMHILLQSSYEF